jgi:hypothetical protein
MHLEVLIPKELYTRLMQAAMKRPGTMYKNIQSIVVEALEAFLD